MIYPEITINGQQIKLIPLGECACGCGGKTRLAHINCTRLRWIKDRPLRYINRHNTPGWKGGKYKGKFGYVYVYSPEHPNATLDGYVLEHTLVIEKAMGKILRKDAQCHHVNRNPSDNSNANLVACHDDGYHKLLHQRERAIKACGNAKWRKCNYCKQWDAPENLVIREYPQGGVHHLECSRKYARDRYWELKG